MNDDGYKHHRQKLFEFIESSGAEADSNLCDGKVKKIQISISDFKTDPIFLRTSRGYAPNARPTDNLKVMAWLERAASSGTMGFRRKEQLISRFRQYATKLDLYYVLALLMWARREMLPRIQQLRKQTFQSVLDFYNKSMAAPKERIPNKALEKLSLHFGRWIVLNPNTIGRRRSKPGLIEPQARLFAYFLQKQVAVDEGSSICEVCDLFWDAGVIPKPTAQHIASTKTLIYRFINKELGYDSAKKTKKQPRSRQ